jgi:hypothetical protein
MAQKDMIGLYILIANLLEREKTIKFGMSMRIEYRWIDYLTIFSDSKYLYYYEFLDNLSRENMLNIEDEIIKLHKNKRNDSFQIDYFYCEDYKEFHQSVIDVLNKKGINYKVHDTHNFTTKNYDNRPEIFEYKDERKMILQPLSVLDKIDTIENLCTTMYRVVCGYILVKSLCIFAPAFIYSFLYLLTCIY